MCGYEDIRENSMELLASDRRGSKKETIELVNLFPEFVDQVKRNESEVILEIGSGGMPGFLGTDKKFLSKNEKCYWIASDCEPHLVERAKRYEGVLPRYKAVEVDGRELPFVDQQFDEVVFSMVFSDVYRDDIKKMLGEALRVILNNGRIVINEPCDLKTRRGTFRDFITSTALVNFIKKEFPYVEVQEITFKDRGMGWNAPKYGRGDVIDLQVIVKKKQLE